MLSNQKIIIEGLQNLGIIKKEQIDQALLSQKKSQQRLGVLMVKMGFISNEDIVKPLVSQFGIRPLKIKTDQISPKAVEQVNYDFARCHRVVPLKFEKDILTLATDDLFNFVALDNLKDFLHKDLYMVIVESDELDLCLKSIYAKRKEKATPKIEKEVKKELVSEFLRQAKNISGKDEAPIVQLVSLLFEEAYNNRASDVHLEPLEDKFRIRYRIDGVLQETNTPPKRLQGSLISRVKIMAGMDIAEKRLPQDGRIKFNVNDKELDLRVSTIPSIHGESVVVRLLDRSRLVLDLEKLGFSAKDKEGYENLIKLPNGIILVTGPTGCGKTTTLYTSLSQINTPNKKILTLEDPVEYQLVGINQVQVKTEIGLTFASGLRSMLRQAPDIIMVGEIRDYETAAIAIQASLTGHLIFSTLHTNDAPGAVIRLIDMGVKPYLVASTLQGVLAQRLIRTLCSNCKHPFIPEEKQITAFGKNKDQLQGFSFYQKKGCPVCHFSGYKGRLGIYELLILDDEMRSLISERPAGLEISQMASKKGIHNMREDGWQKAAAGVTTLDEILRVTQQ